MIFAPIASVPVSDEPRERLLKDLTAPLVGFYAAMPAEARKAYTGVDGSNRARNLDGSVRVTDVVPENTDIGACARFLAEYEGGNGHTVRSYRRAIVHLLMWSLMIKHKPISSLSRPDFDEFLEFLADPPADWRGPTTRILTKDGEPNPAWRPFEREPLSPRSIRQELAILSSLFAWLVDADYLVKNPLRVMRRKARKALGTDGRKAVSREERAAAAAQIERYFTALQLEALWREACSGTPRERWLVALLRYTGLRIEEVASHQMRNFVESDGHWWLSVIGKGNKLRKVPVGPILLAELERYRMSLDLPPRPDRDDETPLVGSKGGKAITTRHTARIIEPIIQRAAARIEAENPQSASQLRKGSPHWFRHTYVTNLLSSGVNPKFVQLTAGHEKFETTAGYSHAEDNDRYEGICAAELAL